MAQPHYTVLVVEDDLHLRRLLCRTLELRGFSVVDAVNGIEALAALRELRPDAIVTDLRMPGISGGDLCRAVRSRSDLERVPILVITALLPSEREVVDLEGVPGIEVEQKPFRPGALAAHLLELIAAA